MAKVGDKIVIKGFAGHEPSATDYIGKTGVIEFIDGIGQFYGTWGDMVILPEDKYEVLQEGETVHVYEVEGSDPTAYVLPRQLYDLLQQVYETGNANCDCTVDGHSFIGC